MTCSTSTLLAGAAMPTCPCVAAPRRSRSPSLRPRRRRTPQPQPARRRRHRQRRRSRPTNMATRKTHRRHRRRGRAARWSATSRPKTRSTARDVRATGATNISELLDALAPQIGSARGRGGETADPAAQRPAHLRLPRASRHSDRSHPAGRDPARGSRAQIWLSRRPEGREHRPSPALPLDRVQVGGRRRDRRRLCRRPRATSPA